MCRPKRTNVQIFQGKYDINDAGCWIWNACIHSTGYGRMGTSDGKVEYGHRISWLIHKGAIPKGLEVCHHCDIRACVNPEHLFLGTRKDNMMDASRKGRCKMPKASYASSDEHQVAKLTNDQVRLIRSNSGITNVEFSRMYNVNPSTISNAKTGKTFRDVL